MKTFQGLWRIQAGAKVIAKSTWDHGLRMARSGSEPQYCPNCKCTRFSPCHCKIKGQKST